MKKEFLKYNQLEYILSVPDNFSENEEYPLIIFFHGAGGRGNEIDKVCSNPYFLVTDKYKLNAVTFAPQCYANSWFDIFEQLQKFVVFAMNHKFVNKEKVYLIGASMGGYATWQMAMTMPEVFAAIVPICGGGMYWNAQRLKDIAIWAFHGSEDLCVFTEESKKMVAAVNNIGGNAKLTICDGVGHNSWINAYENKELFDWLFMQVKKSQQITKDNYNNQEQFG